MRRSACGPVASSGLYRGEHLSDAVAEDQVGLPVQRRAALVDDDKVIAAELPRQARRGAHLEGGTADDQQVGVADHPAGVVVGLLGQKFPVQRHVRAHHAATAGAAGLAGAVEDEVHPIGGIAAGAVVAPGGAVDLLNVDAPGLLVEPVDVLGHDAVQPPLLFPPGQDPVGGVGLNGAGVQVGAVVVEEHVRLVPQALIGQQIFRLVAGEALLGPVIQAVAAAKVGDAALRGHARAAQKHRVPGPGEHVAERLQALGVGHAIEEFVFHALSPFRRRMPRFLRTYSAKDTAMAAVVRTISAWDTAVGMSANSRCDSARTSRNTVATLPCSSAPSTRPEVRMASRLVTPTTASRRIIRISGTQKAVNRVTRQMSIAPWVSLSAMGSSSLPTSLTMLKRRAILPSSRSVSADRAMMAAAKRLFCRAT